jgi:hypothetical protein
MKEINLDTITEIAAFRAYTSKRTITKVRIQIRIDLTLLNPDPQ